MASLFSGYYRVNYDTRNWLLVAKGLAEDPSQFPPQSKAQIINDAFALASSGRLDIAIALEAMTFLKKEKDLIVWQTTIKILEKMDESIGSTAANPLFEVNIKSIHPIALKCATSHLWTPVTERDEFQRWPKVLCSDFGLATVVDQLADSSTRVQIFIFKV